jgi:opacity protein-like surface antigen
MKLASIKLAILFVLLLSLSAFGQQQGLTFDFLGGGARAAGMGKAFLAVSDDGTAGTWNPAGLYVHEKTMMVFSYGYFMPRGRMTYRYDQPNWYGYNHEGAFGSLNYLNIVTPLRIKGHHVVGNVSYSRNFDVYNRFGEILFGHNYWLSDEPNSLSETQGGLSHVSFGLGTRVYDQFSFGLSANIYTGDVVTEETRYIYGDTTISSTHILVENWVYTTDSLRLSGFNLSFGMLYVGDNLRAGAVIRTPFNMKGESDSTQVYITTLNGVGLGYGYNVPRPFLESDTIYTLPTRASKIEIPLTIGLGLAYNIDDNWLVSGDVEYKKFSGKKIYNMAGGDALSWGPSGGDPIIEYTDTMNIPNFSDVFQFRIGTEYILNTSIGEIPLRLGFRNEAFPQGSIESYGIEYTGPLASVPDSSQIFYKFNYGTNQITGFSLSGGTGIHWSQVLLDVAYTYSHFEQDIYRYESGTRQRIYNEWKNHQVTMTFTGYF